MHAMSLAGPWEKANERRAEEILAARVHRLDRSVDANFAILMLCQWLAAVCLALFLSPIASWTDEGTTHSRVWFALTCGGALTVLPVALARALPGRSLTRQCVAVCQMLMSALLIYLTAGRIETRFYEFGSLAFLAFYRDGRVLFTASVVVAVEHFLSGKFWPESAFAAEIVSPSRWLEHMGWVIYEDIFLLISIRQNRGKMAGIAGQQAKLEAVNDDIERQVIERTAELAKENAERKRSQQALHESEQRFRQMAENISQVFWLASADLAELIYVSPAYEKLWGKSCESVAANPQSRLDSIFAEDRARVLGAVAALAHSDSYDIEYRLTREEGANLWIRERGFPVRDSAGQIVRVCGISEDISAAKEAAAELCRTEMELRSASRRAGMAEVATSVLHNVGNVLNSVNTSLAVATEKVGELKGAGLGRVAELLTERADNLPEFFRVDPQATRLPKFLTQLAGHLHAGHGEILGELEALRSNLDHINEIVAMQQSYATSGGVFEPLSLGGVIDDALRMNAAAFERSDRRVLCEFDPALPPVPVDRNKLLLILVNLIRNAKHACDETGCAGGGITIRTQMRDRDCATISVSDEGIGIPQENLPRIFAHGFTTKKNGHGFGLHSSALAAREMGGSLHASSEGSGRGATFTIALPFHPKR